MIELGIARSPAVEHRQAAGGFGYTDAIVEALLARAGGAAAVNSAATGGLQLAAGVVSRAFMAAEADGDMGLLGSRVLGDIGFDLIRYGEAAYYFDMRTGRPRLLRVNVGSELVVSGAGSDPAGWRYVLTLAGPGTTETISTGAESVIHVRINTDSLQPWRGRAPLEVASLTGRLMAGLEDAMGSEAAVAVLRFIPAAVGMGQAIKGSLRGAMTDPSQGRVLVPETTQTGFGGGRAQAPATDWKTNRVGPEFQPADPGIYGAVLQAVALACGVPPALVNGAAGGPALREGWRSLLVGTIQPWGELVSEEVSRVLERPVTLKHWRLAGADSAARARAVHVLTESGIDEREALALVGWESAA